MTRLVDDLLDVSRITRGTIELRLDQVDMRDVVAHGIEAAKPLLASRRHESVVTLPAEPLWVRGDAMRLAQTVGNLLTTPPSTPSSGATSRSRAAREDRQVVVRVRDNGIGISPDMLAQHLRALRAGPSRGNTVRGGLGIGLTLVQRLAELHGGRIEATATAPDRGSEFGLRLPVAAEHRARLHRPERGTPRSLKVAAQGPRGRRQHRRRGSARRRCWSGGATRRPAQGRPCGAGCGRVVRARRRPARPRPAEARRVRGRAPLRRAGQLARCVLIALTGFGQEHHIQRTQEAGFDRHFVKPIDIPALRSLLRRAPPEPGPELDALAV